MRWPEINTLLDVSRETIRGWEKKGIFPESIKLGPNTVAWNREQIEEWILSKKKSPENQ